MDVCQQCHLQRGVSLLKEANTQFDYRPSLDMNDHFVMFELQSPREIEQAENVAKNIALLAPNDELARQILTADR